MINKDHHHHRIIQLWFLGPGVGTLSGRRHHLHGVKRKKIGAGQKGSGRGRRTEALTEEHMVSLRGGGGTSTNAGIY